MNSVLYSVPVSSVDDVCVPESSGFEVEGGTASSGIFTSAYGNADCKNAKHVFQRTSKLAT